MVYLRFMTNKAIDELRSFNRFYTTVIGLVDKHYLDSQYNLAEVRILYELYHGKDLTASDLIRTLAIDKGYLSRVLAHFEKRKFIARERSEVDTRVFQLSLTAAGRKEFEALDKASSEQVRALIKNIPPNDLAVLLESMAEIKRILSQN